MTDVTGAPADVLHTLFHSDQGGHEQVVLCQDRASGLKAVIAIHSTALGPALGGTRFYPYASEQEAVADALNLARGMSYKNAMAGLDHGGGKAVIIGDPEQIKSEELLLAYGRFVASLGGRYVTACDVGTYVADMDVVARECRWTTGRSPENGGAGDSSVLTAFGVFQGMRASAQHLWGDPTLRGRKVGVMRRRQGGPPPGRSPARGRRRGRDHGRTGRLGAADSGPAPVRRDRRRGHRGTHPHRGPRHLRAVRAGRSAQRRLRAGAHRQDRVRCRQQPAGAPGRGEGPRGPRHPVRPRLRGERGRCHPGRRRAARLRLRPVQGQGVEDLRHHAGHIRTCEAGRDSMRPRRPTGSPSSGWRRHGVTDAFRGHTCLSGPADGPLGENSHVCRRVVRQEEVKIAVDQRGQGTSRVLGEGACCGRRTVWARAQVPWKPYGPVSPRRVRSRS